MNAIQGFTYEIDATAVARIRTGYQNLDNVTVDWSGDYAAISYITPIDIQKQFIELRLSKVLTLSDSNTTLRTNVKAVATDLTWSPTIFSAEDTGACSWEIGMVQRYNTPDICIQDSNIVVKHEGDNGDRTTAVLEVCLSEPAYGEPLTVQWTTRDGTAIGGVGVRNLAYDEFNNPFISVTESIKEQVRIVYDGGFPKYYDAVNNANSIQFLKNAVAYLHHNPNRPRRILAIGDPHGAYDITVAGGSNFRNTFQGVANALGYDIEFHHINNFHGGNPTGSAFDSYGMCFYMGTNGPRITEPSGVTGFEQAIKSGMGIMLITDHDAFQGSVNQIAARFGAHFWGVVDRSPVSIDDLKSKYGDHVLWSNMSGILSAGGSEGNIGNKKQSDYLSADGLLTFNVGEQCKNIEVEILGDTEIEGPEYFYIDLFNPNHGQITCKTGTITIEDDDILPCGASASAGGDGVAYYKLTAGSEPKVLAVAWRAYGRHDRFDVFKNGAWYGGSHQDLDHLSEPNSRPSYDRPKYNELTGSTDGTAVMELRQNKKNRAGCGVIFVTMQPLITSDPFVVDLRAEGPSGTGWDMAAVCIDPTVLSNGTVNLNNRQFQRIDQRTLLDCDGQLNDGESATYRMRFKNENNDIFGTGNESGVEWYVHSGQTFSFVAITCHVQLIRDGVEIIAARHIPAGGEATLEWSHTKKSDFRYIEMYVTYQVNEAGSSYYRVTEDSSNQSPPLRVAWTATVQKV